MELLTNISSTNTILDWISYFIFLVVGASVVGIFTYFKMKKKKEDQDAKDLAQEEKDIDQIEKEEDRLVDMYKKTVELFKTRLDDKDKECNDLKQELMDLRTVMGNMSKKLDGLQQKMALVEKERNTLAEILKGRDKASQEFQQNVMSAVNIIAATHDIAKANADNLQSLLNIINDKNLWKQSRV